MLMDNYSFENSFNFKQVIYSIASSFQNVLIYLFLFQKSNPPKDEVMLFTITITIQLVFQ